MQLSEYEQLQPNIRAEDLTWLTPNSHVAWRVNTLQTKEPDTYAWVNSMGPGDVLFDVGANIGQYSLLAAKRGVTVHAFEPEAQNFALLIRNIAINNLSDLCIAWPLALSNQPSLDILHLSTLMVGGSCHAFGESKNYQGETKQFPYRQGSVATTLDAFAPQHGYPTHIKIDVDGFEHKVIEGGYTVLSQAKSVLIEINTNYPDHMNFILPRMAHLGFTYDEAQVEAARRKDGPFKGVGNYIFNRV